MKITLVQAPCVTYPMPPNIGLAYISAVLKKAGHEVSVFELNIELYYKVSESDRKGWQCKDIIDLQQHANKIITSYTNIIDVYIDNIIKSESAIIGFSVQDSSLFSSLYLAKRIKELDNNRIIVFGGHECPPLWSGYTAINRDEVDIVVYGEGEQTILELVELLEKKHAIEYCPGCIIKRAGKIIDCGPREVIKDLENLPYPDYTYLPLRNSSTVIHLSISASRGCPRNCKYCVTPQLMPGYRWRSAESIIKEIKYQINKYGKNRHIYFEFCDPALNSNPKELSKLCDFIINEELNMSWGGFTMVHPAMEPELLTKMKKAGCSVLAIGIESGSQKILDLMNRGYKVEDAKNMLRNASEIGMTTNICFIIGFPEETEKDFQETLDFISENKEYISHIHSGAPTWIPRYSYIYDHFDEINIVHDFSRYNYDWYSKDMKNTKHMREHRLRIFEELLRENGINSALFD